MVALDNYPRIKNIQFPNQVSSLRARPCLWSVCLCIVLLSILCKHRIISIISSAFSVSISHLDAIVDIHMNLFPFVKLSTKYGSAASCCTPAWF